AGRSNGGRWLNPNDSAPERNVPLPRSRPICANEVLHDRARIRFRAPPQADPPKFGRLRVVNSRSSDVSVGYTGWSTVTAPVCTPVAAVTTLNVDPGG